MLSLRWMVDFCSFTCWGASARVGFILVFPFAYSSPTASDVGGISLWGSAGLNKISLAALKKGYFEG